jgi:hypothetical protein
LIAVSPIPIFTFYLVNSLGESYYIDSEGNLATSGLPRPIVYSPDGWENMAIGWERNLFLFGLIRNFSLSLGFFGDGAVILQKLYCRKNIDEKVLLLVQKVEEEVTDTDFALTHKFYYKGEIDLSTFRNQRRKVLVNIMEGGRSKELKANGGTNYEIPIYDNARRIRVKMDGFNIQSSVNFLAIEQATFANVGFYGLQWLTMAFISNEGTVANGAGASVNAPEVWNSNTDYDDNRYPSAYFFEATDSITVKLSFPVYITLVNGSKSELYVRRSDGTRFSLGVVQDLTGSPVPFEKRELVNVNASIPMTAGQKLYLIVQTTRSFSFPAATTITSEFLPAVKFDSRYKTTFIYCLKALDLYKELVKKVSGSEDYAVSSLLESSSLCHTSGDAIRGLFGSVIKISLNTLVSSWSVVKCAGLGIEGGKFVLERKSHFLRDDVIVDLGEVKELEISAATDIIFNSLKIGYNDQDYEDVNGRYEFNTLTERGTPVQRVSKTLELISDLRADPVGIELTRINLDGKNTTDANADNDGFFLNVDLDNPQTDDLGTYYNLKRAVYTSVTGIPDPDNIFNIEELTPFRIFTEWAQYIAGALSGFSGYINFLSSKKNRNLETIGGPGGDFDEDRDVLIGSLPAPLFGNSKFSFKAVASSSLVKTLSETPYACFRFTYQGGTYKGYFLKGSIICKANQEQSFVLLSHSDNDLTTFENG